jgi:hypothetical protein
MVIAKIYSLLVDVKVCYLWAELNLINLVNFFPFIYSA